MIHLAMFCFSFGVSSAIIHRLPCFVGSGVPFINEFKFLF
jgi:hypothetical protein